VWLSQRSDREDALQEKTSAMTSPRFYKIQNESRTPALIFDRLNDAAEDLAASITDELGSDVEGRVLARTGDFRGHANWRIGVLQRGRLEAIIMIDWDETSNENDVGIRIAKPKHVLHLPAVAASVLVAASAAAGLQSFVSAEAILAFALVSGGFAVFATDLVGRARNWLRPAPVADIWTRLNSLTQGVGESLSPA
jgi:hypothetical protein